MDSNVLILRAVMSKASGPNPGAPRELRVPHPKPGPGLVLLVTCWVAAVVSFAYALQLTYVMRGTHQPDLESMFVGCLVLGAFLTVLPYLVPPRTLLLRRKDGQVVGVPSRKPIALGDHTVEVAGVTEWVDPRHPGDRADEQTHEEPRLRHNISHSTAGVLFGDCRNELRVRAFAEGLAKVGGFHLQWNAKGTPEAELRAAEELDHPLANRLARGVVAVTALRRPADARVYGAQAADGRLVLGWPPPTVRLMLAGWLLGMALVGVVTAMTVGVNHGLRAETASAAAWASGLWSMACLVLFLGHRAVRWRLRVGPDGVASVVHILGVPWSRTVGVQALESVYVEQWRGQWRLILVSDRRFIRHPLTSGAEGLYVRDLVHHVLAGRSIPPDQLPTP